MKSIALSLIVIAAITACSKQPVSKGSTTLPIYVSFDSQGKWLFGPISPAVSLGDGRPVVPGTDHTISVWSSPLHGNDCTLTFEEHTAGGQSVRAEDRVVTLGVGNTFKIFGAVDVTIRNSL